MGLDPDSFWAKTPREANFILEARWRGEMRRQNQFAWLAWHIAALSRAKRLPKLQTMMIKIPARVRQTWQEQMRIMDQWAAVIRKQEAMRKK